MARKLLEAMARPFDLGPQRVDVIASIGGAFLPGPARTAGDIVRAPDAALYESKRKGKNAYTEAGEPAGPAAPGDAG